MNFNTKKGYCCKEIKKVVQGDKGTQETPVKYLPKFRDFVIMNCPNYEHNNASQRFCRPILYCPWCGAQFPPSLGDKYYEILEAEFPHEDCGQSGVPGICIPHEFTSDEWWKKRRL
jgi:hypothetical protein